MAKAAFWTKVQSLVLFSTGKGLDYFLDEVLILSFDQTGG